MRIKLPKNIKHEFEFYFNKKDHGISGFNVISPRNILNCIENDGGIIGYDHALYDYLFNSKGFQQNQLKFLNAFYGQEYEFEDDKFKYLTKDGFTIGYNTICGRFVIQANKYNSDIFAFTRDEILNSPFDINKLTEIKIK